MLVFSMVVFEFYVLHFQFRKNVEHNHGQFEHAHANFLDIKHQVQTKNE